MTETSRNPEITILVYLNLQTKDFQEDLHEFHQLAQTAGAQIVTTITGTREQPDAKYFVGSGKAEEIRLSVLEHKAQLVIVNHALSPAQERNLERLLKCRVIDRTRLILDIFAQRARSFEGKLQVEMAQLQHMATRLVRGWTHLERQRGGIGLRGGPGETQLETDRRLLRERIKNIQKRLEKVRVQRSQARRARQQAVIPTVALVGYTNAGKSTLFNALVNENTYVADQLFATLDPTFRRLTLPQLGEVILADTVGFIRDLPHELIDAFRATLDETRDANLLLHVIDASDPLCQFHAEQVRAVLREIKAEHVPRLEIYNKIDKLPQGEPHVEGKTSEQMTRVWLSAASNLGIDLLKDVLVHELSKDVISHDCCLAPTEGRLRATLYEIGSVTAEHIDQEGNHHLSLRIKKVDFERLFS